MAQQNPAGKAAKSFSATELGFDLFINIMEAKKGTIKRAGLYTNLFNRFGPQARQKVETLLRTNQSLLPFLETGFKGLLFAALPGMSNGMRMSVSSVVDWATDLVRQAAYESDPQRAEALVAEAAKGFREGMDKALEEEIKMRKAKLPYVDLLPKLAQAESDDFSAWIEWMSTEDPTSHKKWIEYRDLIGSLDIARQLLRRVGGNFAETTKRRMAFLVGAIGRNPTFLDEASTWKDKALKALRGDGDIESRVAAFTAKANAFAAEQEQASELIREWNAPREPLRGYPKLRLLVAGVFCVLLPIVAIVYIWSQSAPKLEVLKSYHVGAVKDGKK